MKSTRVKLAVAVIIPILCLAIWVGSMAIDLHTGTEITIPAAGIDPRDPLAGHYLTYRPLYPPKLCEVGMSSLKPYYVCLWEENGRINGYSMGQKCPASKPADCQVVLQGNCRGSEFSADIERYYIPEESAPLLNSIMATSRRCSIVVSVNQKGKPKVKDLLIDGRSWREIYKR
ncbi:MAG TPA: GDYXXLXY domain-containing protein [bacterium]|nr:GDYXXLXY domain-containing protein [bacterium]